MPLEVPQFNSSNAQLAGAYQKVAKLEQTKLNKFDEKSQKIDDQLKLVQDLKSRFGKIKESLVPFKTPSDFKDLKGFSSHEDIAVISSIDKTLAEVGSYELEVLNLANTNSIMTYGMADRDKSEVGVGYISFKTGTGENKEVYIGTDNNTLDGVASAINSAKLGVRAFVVNDGTDADEPWRLVVTGEGTGWKNDIEWPEFYLLDGDLEFDRERTREAKSAIIRFNGMPLMADENTIKNLLPGINIDLKSAKEGQSIKLDVKPDFEAIEGKAKGFVDSMNEVFTFIQNQNQLGADSHKDASKSLGGDVGLQAIESRMRSIIQLTQNELDTSTIQGLRNVGIVFNRNGTLDYDTKKFQKELETDFEGVSSLFAGTSPLTGFANKMIALVDGMTRSGDGMMSIKESSLKSKKDRLESDKERATQRAEKRLEKVSSQFSRAEAAIQQMQQSQAGLPPQGA